MKTSLNKLIFTSLLAGVALLAGMLFQKSQQATAYTGCSLTAANQAAVSSSAEWDSGGFHYIVWEIGIRANGNPLAAEVGTGEELDNTQDPTCGGTSHDIASYEWVAGGNARPIGAFLGVPSSLSHPNGGNWGAEEINPPRAETEGVYAKTWGRPAAIVDDAANIRINGSPILCAGMPECGTPVYNTPTRNGAGAIFIQDNCPGDGLPDGQGKQLNCALSNSLFNVTSNDLTGYFYPNPDGTLNSFNLEVHAFNTHAEGFRASLFITMKYSQPSYNHIATLGSCTYNTSTVQPDTVFSCNPGMENRGTADGPQTFIEFYEKNHAGAYTEGFNPPPGPGLDSKLTAYYDYQTSSMASGYGTQPHYVWVRSSTPRFSYPDYSVQYQPTKFKVKSGTPIGTQLCFVTRATADPYGKSNSVASSEKCYTVGQTGGGGPGPDPAPQACRQANPQLPNLPEVTVHLPDRAPDSNAPSGATNSPGQTYHEYNPQRKTKVTNIGDISAGGNRVPPSLARESYQQAVLNYNSFINTYPYDFSQPNVTYDSYYNDVTWRTSYSPDYYTCNPGDSGGGSSSTCTHRYQETYSCPTKKNPGRTCKRWRSYSYGGTPWYNWNEQYTTERREPNTVNGDQMNPCYDRGFRNGRASAGQPQFDDEENPSNVTFNDTGAVDMWLPSGNKGLRQSLKVQLDATANFYIKHADGSTGPFTQGKQRSELPATNTMYDSGSTQPTASDSHTYIDVFTATLPPLRTGDKACVVFTVSQQQGTMRVDGSRTSQSGSSTTSETCSAPLVDKPYFRVYGSDIQAGGAFEGGNCNQTGTITAFWRDSTSAGAGSQFGALALGQITGFGSATLRGGGTPFRPLGLTFANTNTNVTGEQKGGNFAITHCITDYWSKKPSSISAQNTNSYSDTATVEEAVFLAPPSGTATITSGGGITGSKTIYVDGNAVLSGNFIYETPDIWTDENDIPSLFIIARGNIYIDPGTTQLDGVFIAQPRDAANPTDGKIYTCANGTTPVPLGSLYASCNQRLTINGAFIASQVKLLRTASSLRHGTADEQPQGLPHACAPTGASLAPVCAAEVFNFGPEVYLAQPALPIVRSAYQGKYDYITSLPPIL